MGQKRTTLGCGALVLLAAVVATLGWDVAGLFSVFAWFALIGHDAFRHGEFGWLFSNHSLKRATRPAAFWMVFALTVAAASFSAWRFSKAVFSAMAVSGA